MLKRAVPAALLFTALDQGTKWLAVRWHEKCLLEGRETVLDIIPHFFNFVFATNDGASFGFLSGQRWPLSVFALVALALLTVFRKKIFPPCQPLPAVTFALLAGGIAGNLIDRVRIAEVVDFIHFYWRAWSFPVFNIADMCITFGLGLYIAGQVVAERNARRAAREAAAESTGAE